NLSGLGGLVYSDGCCAGVFRPRRRRDESVDPTDLRTKLRARPFEPFRIVTSDGTVYEARHPHLVVGTIGAAHVGDPHPAEEGIARGVDFASLANRARREPLAGAASAAPGRGDGKPEGT